jgi:hypothetical protein
VRVCLCACCTVCDRLTTLGVAVCHRAQSLVDLALSGAEKARSEASKAHEDAVRCRKEAHAARQATRAAEAKAARCLGMRVCVECGERLRPTCES